MPYSCGFGIGHFLGLMRDRRYCVWGYFCGNTNVKGIFALDMVRFRRLD